MKLHIGGEQAKEGWKILNSQLKAGVDFLGDVRNLGNFAEDSCSEIYASHVLEHVGFFESDKVIKQIFRILKKGGKFYISVPDLEVITEFFLKEKDLERKIEFLRIIYGGQMDNYDFHYMGYWKDLLFRLLKNIGFSSYQKVDSFNIFNDTSELKINGRLISLNIIATK
jgi:predicted SAM-dependent methyltransferase